MKKTLFICLMSLMAVTAPAQRHHDHPGNHRPEHHQEHHRAIECASREQMNMTMHVLGQQSFDDKKLEIAKLCVTLGHFCVEDLARMAATFSFDENRLHFLTYAYDYCEDPQNYYALRDSFSFRSHFDRMMETLHPAHSGPRRR